MSSEPAGAGTEQAGGENVPRINADDADPEKPLPQRTPIRLPFRKLRVAQGKLRNTEKQESKDRKGKNLPLIHTDDTDQKRPKPLTTEDTDQERPKPLTTEDTHSTPLSQA